MATITNTVKFVTNVEELRAQLKKGEDQIVATEASAKKLVESLGGDRLIAAAHRYAAAVSEIGGVAKLTAAEQGRVNDVVEKALAKYQALGQQAPTALKQLAEATRGLSAESQAIGKLADSLGGRDTIASAQRYAAAVQQVGGAAKLTRSEQEQVNKTVTDAIAKYKALGQTAPAALQELADATTRTERSSGLLSSTFKQMFAAFSAANLVDRAVGTLMNVGREALDTASSLVDLSNKTGLSTETLQRMQFVAKQSGSDMGTFADAVFKMGVNISEGTKKVRDGAEALGLSWTALREASPDDQFNMVVKALERMEDPQKRNEAAVALFGKTAKEVLPAIVDGYTKVAEGATVAGDAQVRALDAAGDAWDRFKARTTTGMVNVLGSIVLLREATNGLTDDEKAFVLQTMQSGASIEAYDAALIRFWQAKQKAKDISLAPAAPAVSASFIADLKAAEEGYRNLTAAQREELFTALRLNKDNDQIINKLNISADVLTLGKKAYEDYKQAISATEAPLKNLTKSLTETAIKLTPLPGQFVLVRDQVTTYGEEAAKLVQQADVMGVKVPASVRAIADAWNSAQLSQLIGKVSATWVKDFDDFNKKAAEKMTGTARTIADALLSTGPVDLTKHLTDAIIKNDALLRTNADATAKAIEQRTFTSTEFQIAQVTRWVKEEKAKVDTHVGNWRDAFAAIDAAAEEKFAAIAAAESLVTMKQAVTAAGADAEKGFVAGFGRVVTDVPSLITQAFTGGGGAMGALSALSSKIGGELGKSLFGGKFGEKFADGLGKLFGNSTKWVQSLTSMIPGIGQALGSLLPVFASGFKKLFGGASAEELKGRAAVQDFEAQLAKTLTATQKAEAGGQSWKLTVIGVRDAYLATGHSAEEADAAVKRLWNTKDPEAYKKALDEINGVLNEQKQDQQDLDAAIQRYGFSIEQLGPALQKQKLDEQAKQLLNDWRLLVGSGIDVATVDAKMAASINDYLKLAKQTGQEVPAAMKPILQTMIQNGTLTDDAGNAITDMGQLGVTWAESMTQGFDRVVDKLQQLLEGLGLVPKALDNIPTEKEITITPRMGIPVEEGGIAGRDMAASRGGLVTARGIQHFDLGGLVQKSGWRMPWTLAPIGTDSVPAMLTPGELILNQGQQAQIAGLLEKGAQLASGVIAGGKHVGGAVSDILNVTFNISTVDATGMDQVCEKQIMPRLTSMIEDRRRGHTARWQQALGTT